MFFRSCVAQGQAAEMGPSLVTCLGVIRRVQWRFDFNFLLIVIIKPFFYFCRPFGSFTQRVKFCYAAAGARRSFSRIKCDAGWNSDFDLFGGTEDLNTTIKLYNYARIGSPSVASNLLLDDSITDKFTLSSNAINPIVIPGKHHTICGYPILADDA